MLFHFNGHGVPLPTQNGEIWVFNHNITQYIPVSLFDIQLNLGRSVFLLDVVHLHQILLPYSPALLIYDCHSAGTIVKHFNRFAEQQQLVGAANN